MTTASKSSVLKDVVAYVDVWSADKTANYSKPFVQQLEQMGAKVSKTFNKEVTHVVFNHGHLATWRKAKKNNVRLVSLLWISRCKEDGVQVDEELFPALNDESNPVVKNKKHRCMRPKDSDEKTPDSDRRIRKKLDKMLKVLSPKEPVCTDVSTVFIDEKNGIVYSPALKRSEYMARRLKDMKEKRENLSPTSSQMLGSDLPTELRISQGNTPEVLKLMFENSEDEALPVSTVKRDYSPKEKGSKEPEHSERSVVTNSTRPSLSLNTIDQTDSSDVVEKKGNAKKSRSATTTRQKQQDEPFSDGPRLNRKSGVIRNMNKETRSQMKSYDQLLNTSDRQKNVVGTSLTETNCIFYTEPEEASSYPPLSTLLDPDASETSKDAAALSHRVELKTPKRASSSFSSLVRSFTPSSDSKGAEVASINGDDNDDVFEDYFSPANHRQRSKEHSLPNLSSTRSILIPFDLAPVQKKRKQRKSETLGLERQDSKKKKVDQKQSGKNDNQQFDPRCLLEIHQDDFKDPPRRNLSAEESLEAETARQSSLGSRRRSNPSDKTLKPNHQSTSAQPALLTDEGKSDIRNHSHIMENVGYESTLPTGFPVMCSDAERIKDSWSPQNMPRKLKAVKTLVMTSMPTEKQNIVFQVVKALGGFLVVDRVCESTTHVVSGGHKRTLNILLGIARGCWILSFEWILWCLEQRQWVSEEPYELSDQFPAAQICRLQRHLSAGEHQQDLFQGQPAMFVSQHSQPPTHSLVELIELCGGTVSRNVRQAGICIGKYNSRRPEGSRILSEQWVLDSITQLKLLPYDNYDLECF